MLQRTRASAVAALGLVVFLNGSSHAQLSTYASATRAYQANPLYNFERIGDQVSQAFLEVAYSAGSFRGRYRGGLTLFNRLLERNYLDHSLLCELALDPSEPLDQPSPDSTGVEYIDREEGDEAAGAEDSLGVFGGIVAGLAARHDRAVFREFDNFSAQLGGSVRWGFDGWRARLNADGGYRAYPHLRELSSSTAVLAGEAMIGRSVGFSWGIRPLLGVKHFITGAYDSARFEPERTYITVTKPGSGKGGAKITVKETSGKEILSNADVRTVGHFAGAAFARFGWITGSIRTEVLYRRNLSASARILARTAETATINEDIYDDFFSYTGPEAGLVLRQTLPFSIQSIVSISYQRKMYGAPAFDLGGVEVAGTRVDRRRKLEWYASRYFSLSAESGFDVALGGEIVRNESNDAYNDFSGWSVGCSLGVGF